MQLVTYLNEGHDKLAMLVNGNYTQPTPCTRPSHQYGDVLNYGTMLCRWQGRWKTG